MGSSIRCTCGAIVWKNLVSNNQVAFLVPEEYVSRDLAAVSVEQLAAQVMFSEIVLVCKACERLHVLDEHGDKPDRVYVREVTSD